MKYIKPTIDLLTNQIQVSDIDSEYLDGICRKVQEVFDAFSMNAKVVGNKVSPLNIILDVNLDVGIKLKDVSTLSQNIELSLGTPIKLFCDTDESQMIQIAIPHAESELVRLRKVIETDSFKKLNSSLGIAAGVDEKGKPVVLDLEDTPHMMITGVTGSGKTVFMDDIILSIISKASPDEVKFLLIDPVRSDFRAYDDMPHLICPVLSNKGEIANALSLIAEEINTRNRLIFEHGKTITAYNSNVTGKDRLCRIVVIIDKFLDLVDDVPKSIKDSINKIASQGRSVGIHIIINTQSPYSEVVDGTTKANLTCRVAFSLTTGYESRAAIERTGAEKLSNPGEMLIVQGGDRRSIHAQASYVSYEEIKSFIKDLKEKNDSPVYQGAFAEVHEDIVVLEDRALMIKALEFILQNVKTSADQIRKELKLTEAESYEMIRILEQNGFIDSYHQGYHKVLYEQVSEALKFLA